MSVLLTIFRHSKFKSDSKRIIRSGHFAEVDEGASRPHHRNGNDGYKGKFSGRGVWFCISYRPNPLEIV